MAGVLALLVLSGCVNLGSVREFAGESKKLGASFQVMPLLVMDTCRTDQRLAQQVLHADTPFRLTEVNARADVACAGLSNDEANFLPFARLLEQYGDALAALADEKLPNYTVQLDALQASVATVKDDAGQPLLSAERAQAVVSLGKFLGRIVTERVASNEIRNLLDQRQGVQAATGALSWYANRTYRQQLSTYAVHLDATAAGKLPQFEKTEPLAARAMMIGLDKERTRTAELVKAADTFVSAAAKLDGGRADVLAHLDRPSDRARLEQLAALASEVQALRKQLRAFDD